jgi:hypothetical protein
VGEASGALATQRPPGSGVWRSGRNSSEQLSWWKWHLARKAAAAKGSPGLAKMRFVPARIVEQSAPARSDSRVEVVLTNGRVMRIVGAVDVKLLTELIQVIESLG